MGLEGAGHLHVELLDVLAVLKHFGGGELASLGDFSDLVVSESNYHVLWLKISMDNFTLTVHVIKANQTLPCQLANQRNWHALVLVAFNQLEEVDAQNLKDHYKVFAIGPMMDKGIKQLDTVTSYTTHAMLAKSSEQLRIIAIVFVHGLAPLLALPVGRDLVEDLYLVVSGFQVVLSTLLHLDGNIRVELKIFGQPNCAEVAPAELLDDHIPVKENFTHVNWVVAANLVVGHSLVLARLLLVKE